MAGIDGESKVRQWVIGIVTICREDQASTAPGHRFRPTSAGPLGGGVTGPARTKRIPLPLLPIPCPHRPQTLVLTHRHRPPLDRWSAEPTTQQGPIPRSISSSTPPGVPRSTMCCHWLSTPGAMWPPLARRWIQCPGPVGCSPVPVTLRAARCGSRSSNARTPCSLLTVIVSPVVHLTMNSSLRGTR